LKRSAEAGEPTGAREHFCGPSAILTADVKGAREGARVKIVLVGRPQTAGWYPPNEVSREAGAMRGASRSGAGLTIRRLGLTARLRREGKALCEGGAALAHDIRVDCAVYSVGNADEKDELLAARNGGVEEIPLEHHVVLRVD